MAGLSKSGHPVYVSLVYLPAAIYCVTCARMQEDKGKYRELMQYAGLATQWLVLLGVSLWIGMKIDEQISATARICTIALPLIALIVSLWQLIRKFDKPRK